MKEFKFINQLTTFSVTTENSLGRVFHAPSVSKSFSIDGRDAFEKDADRILYSNAFRRLDAKTQVFDNSLGPRGHYYRTRLTHSLEVKQVASVMARYLGANRHLSEALALGHDIGHPPFGHEGQDVLQKIMRDYGGFEHNLQAIRVVDYIEDVQTFNGLNLMYETREGLLKHCSLADAKALNNINQEAFLRRNSISANDVNFDVLNGISERHIYKQQPYLEAQITDEADAIAYTCGDLVDGFRSGLISLSQARVASRLVERVYDELKRTRPHDPEDKIEDALHSSLLEYLIFDIICQTEENIISNKIQTIMDIKNQKDYLVSFSPSVKEEFLELKRYLRHNLYLNPLVTQSRANATLIIEGLFDYHFTNAKEALPEKYQRIAEFDGLHRAVCDYVGGMTDSYAYSKYVELKLGNIEQQQSFFTL